MKSAPCLPRHTTSFSRFKLLAGIGSLLAVAAWHATAAAQEAQKYVTVAADRAAVQSGKTTLGYAEKGMIYESLRSTPGWEFLEIVVDGKPVKGWASADQLRTVEKTSAKKSEPSLRIIRADKASLRVGSNVLATLRRGQIVPVLQKLDGWYKVRMPIEGKPVTGYLSAKDVESVQDSYAGLSVEGAAPFSVNSAAAKYDDSTKSVTISITIPRSASNKVLRPIIPPSAGTISGQPRCKQTSDALEITANAEELRSILAPGTRSFWIGEADDAASPIDVKSAVVHRVDLPAVALDNTVRGARYDSFKEGLLVIIPVTGLLPGFVVESGPEDASRGALRAIPTKAGSFPRLVDVYADGAQQNIRIAVPFMPQGQEEVKQQFQVRNLDGSRSNVVLISRTGDKVEKEAKSVAAALPQLLDSTISVPSVDILNAAEALEKTYAAELRPVLVRKLTLDKQSSGVAREALIVRQGVPAGQRALAGSNLLLVVDGDQQIPSRVISPGSDTVPQVEIQGGLIGGGIIDNNFLLSGGLTGSSGLNAVDAADDLNYIDPNSTGLMNDATGGAGDNSVTVVDDSNLDGQLVTGGGLDTGLLPDAGGLPDMGGFLPPDEGGPPNPGGGDNVLVIDSDPGVLIDPTMTDEGRLLATILKLVLQALLQQPSAVDLSGPLGGSLSQAILQFEKPLIGAFDPAIKQQVAQAPIDKILDLVTGRLAIKLPPADRQRAIDQWRQYAAARWQPALLDRNRNGLLADDTAAWCAVWLFRNGFFNPASTATIAVSSGGQPVAVMPAGVQSVDWLKDIKFPAVTPSLPVVTLPSQNTAPPATPASKPKIPTGKALVSHSSTPDRVRVPQVRDQLVTAGSTQMTGLGLRIKDINELFDSDKIVRTAPEASKWVPSGSWVALDVVRRVPDLTQLTQSEAAVRAAKLRFKTTAEGKVFPDDVVIGQVPAIGTYVSIREPLQLTLGVVVPDILDQQMKTAVEQLKRKDLAQETPTKAFDVDKVVSQVPQGGAISRHGTVVKLEVHLPTPNVNGMTLAQARAKLLQWDLKPEVPNQLALDGDFVRGQSPQAGTYVPHESESRLDPVRGIVPDFTGQTIAQATNQLRNAEKYEALTIGELLQEDVVTAQSPAAGSELERGKAVTLDARVTVPDVERQDIADARNRITNGPGGLTAQVRGNVGRNDVVYSQSPEGGSRAMPRTVVELVPGVNVPRLVRMSPQQADAALREAALNGRITSSSTRETTDQTQVGRTMIVGQNPNPGLYPREQVELVELEATTFLLARRNVPNVVGNAVSVAANRLQGAEFEVRIVQDGQVFTPIQWGIEQVRIALLIQQQNGRYVESTVRSQNPQGGTPAILGSTVTIEAVRPSF